MIRLLLFSLFASAAVAADYTNLLTGLALVSGDTLHQPVAAASCVTLSQWNTNRSGYAPDTPFQCGATAAKKYLASIFTASNSVTVCKVFMKGWGANAIDNTNTWKLGVYTDSGGPGDLVGESAPIVVKTLPATPGSVFPVTISVSLTQDTKYWLVATITDSTLWYSYIRFGSSVSESGSDAMKYSPNFINWTNITQNNSEHWVAFISQ